MTYVFAPSPPGAPAFGAPGAPVLDLVGRSSVLDDADRAAVTAVAALPGAIALWRSWQLDGPTRVYVLATTGKPPAFPAHCYTPGDDLSPYVRAARRSSALLWTAADAPPLRLAQVFDADGGFAPDHERLDGPGRDHVLAYLTAGAAVLGTTDRGTDVVDPERGAVVPLDLRTDGRWIWPDMVTYYLREHGLAPEPDLLADIRAAAAPPAVDPVGEHRALAALFQSGALSPAGSA
ncbi:hypothetical protein [Actinoplanes awajinensis]|uniref:Uncharacterized protein n=1 Tax=Actinoplanes awajinensis subsp. mycoplanecinus TaxID=135947 RepID=A0A117MN47_9ACTN|nr:hypothetical protein [Actinoplanes awajinensis]KUL26276.1 hypothetical protein ADL15_38410 [Actinoplanes awajinensis subsp. mycoplanecinus]